MVIVSDKEALTKPFNFVLKKARTASAEAKEREAAKVIFGDFEFSRQKCRVDIFYSMSRKRARQRGKLWCPWKFKNPRENQTTRGEPGARNGILP